jgi:4-amino-4-deoxy-L-arabinose transferase-like glycosyltransferase
LFVALVLKLHSDEMIGDEGGYMQFAQNILQGFYSPPAPDIDLWWGPGYPILLTPFIAMGLPLVFITLTNAVLQYLSIVMLFKAISQLVDFSKAMAFSLLWGFCYSIYPFMTRILTETFSSFLINLFIYFTIKAFKEGTKKHIYLAGFTLGYLALTKVMFGYVMLFLLLWSLLMWLKNTKVIEYRKSIVIILVGFLTASPYLIYTYKLTDRFFYWGNSGGMSLYWMSNPNDYEYGNWDNETFDSLKDLGGGNTKLLKQNHQEDFEYILQFKGVEKDDAYKKVAIQNIKSHPKKYIKNIYANISRMIFGFPYHYARQTPLIKVWYFAILFSLTLYSIVLTIINWKKLVYSLRFVLVFTFIYLGGSTLLSAYNRQLIIIVPALLLWIAYIVSKSIKFNIKLNRFSEN